MRKDNNFGIIILAGGTGSRFGSNKLLEKLCGIPVIAHSVKNFRKVCPENRIVIVCPDNLKQEFGNAIFSVIGTNNLSFAAGGETRAHSVLNGLNYLRKSNLKYCAVHDAARPLADAELLLNCMKQCSLKGSAVTARKVTDTIKSADENMKVTSNIDRSLLWAMETPQVFRFDEILKAYEYVIKNNISVTDDAGAMETIGKDVFLLENRNPNIKITFYGDIDIAGSIIKSNKNDC